MPPRNLLVAIALGTLATLAHPFVFIWSSPRNDVARGIYGEAMREKQRLLGASDELLEAESLAIRVAR
jgi:hypothetical protein